MARTVEEYIRENGIEISKVSVPIYEEEITARREKLAASDMSEAEKAEINELLDRASRTFVRDEDANKRSTICEKLGSQVDEDTYDEIVTQLTKEENARFRPFFNVETGRLDMWNKGIDKELIDGVKSEKIVISEELKEQLRAAWRLLDEKGFGVDPAITILDRAEASIFQEYVDINTGESREKSREVISGGSIEELRGLVERGEQIRRSLDELFEEGAKIFPGDDGAGYIANNASFRGVHTPVEYKTSVRVSTNLNYASMAQKMMKLTGVEPEDFLADPAGVMREAADRFVKENGLHHYTDGKSLGGALAALSTIDGIKMSFGRFSVADAPMRIFEGFAKMDPNEETRRRNIMLSTITGVEIAAKMNETGMIARGVSDSSFRDMVQNIFLVRDEDRDYSLFGPSKSDTMDTARFCNQECLDKIEYLDSHDITAEELHGRIIDGIMDYVAEGGNNDWHYMTSMVAAARQSAYDLVMIKGIDPKSPGYKMLEQLHDRPLEVLTQESKARGINMTKYKASLRSVKPLSEKRKEIEAGAKAKKKELGAFEKGEKAYNKQADKLTKDIAKLNARLLKKPNDPKAVAALAAKTEALAAARRAEMKKLDDALEQGRITALYHDARSKDVALGEHSRSRSMYVEGLTDRRSFLAEKVKAGIDRKTADMQFRALAAKETAEIRSIAARKVAGIAPKSYAPAPKPIIKAEQKAAAKPTERKKVERSEVAKHMQTREKTKTTARDQRQQTKEQSREISHDD